MTNATVFTLGFTDIYGVEHPAAKCFVSNITRNAAVNFDEKAELANSTTNVNYQLRFWHNEAARAAGAKTQQITNKSGQASFYISVVENDPSMAELEAICEQHFIDNVLSTLNKTPAV